MNMTLREAEALVPEVKRGPECSLMVVRAQLDDQDRDLLDAWLATPKSEMTHTRLSRILKTAGFVVGDSAVSRHRNGECGCRRG
jgi:hypothetical protein